MCGHKLLAGILPSPVRRALVAKCTGGGTSFTSFVQLLPSFLDKRLEGVASYAWWLFSLAKEAVEVPVLMGAIESLKVQGLTRLVVVCTFVHYQILLLRVRAHPLW